MNTTKENVSILLASMIEKRLIAYMNDEINTLSTEQILYAIKDNVILKIDDMEILQQNTVKCIEVIKLNKIEI
jgi:hypothetical protein